MISKQWRLAVLLSLGLTACAAADEADTVKQALQKHMPGREVVSVRPSPVAGVYEVVLKGRRIVYSDAKGDFVFFGDLVDMKARKSITEARTDELSRVDFKSIPLNLAFKEVRGNGSRTLAIFTDPDCPYCMKLEHEGLKGLDNVTLYRFLMPLDGLHPDAARKAALIWCDANPNQAWQKFVQTASLPNNSGKCDSPLKAVADLAEQFGITGTPALIFADGQLVPGAIGKAQIEARFQELAATKTK